MRKWLAGLILIVSVVLLSISIYSLMGMFNEELSNRKTYQELQDMFEKTGDDGTESEPDRAGETESGNSEAVINEGLLALHEVNPDCIAWIRIEDTEIDYPIMYRPEEKNYYLHRDFHGKYSYSGSLFLSEICDPETSDNWIIYGHHMNSGTMFAALEKYKKEAFYKEHPIVTLSTLHGDEQYQIIAAFALPVYTGHEFQYYAFHKAKTALEYEEYIRQCKEASYYDTGLTAQYGERLITLSTCEYSHKNGRMVVVAKRLSEGGD